MMITNEDLTAAVCADCDSMFIMHIEETYTSCPACSDAEVLDFDDES
jgi:Zn finger protein HypA/HybF involved in hydrogenase expression